MSGEESEPELDKGVAPVFSDSDDDLSAHGDRDDACGLVSSRAELLRLQRARQEFMKNTMMNTAAESTAARAAARASSAWVMKMSCNQRK